MGPALSSCLDVFEGGVNGSLHCKHLRGIRSPPGPPSRATETEKVLWIPKVGGRSNEAGPAPGLQTCSAQPMPILSGGWASICAYRSNTIHLRRYSPGCVGYLIPGSSSRAGDLRLPTW